MSLNATHTNKTQLPIATLLLSITMLASITILTGTILASNTVLADDNTSVVDEINITVPVSCTLSGTGMNTHNAEINNGQYNSAIGETTMKAFCNDNNGFAIYAIGYTDDTDGNNVLTSSTLGSEHDIVTGTATSGNTSNWAMKLSTITDPAPTYPIIIAGSTSDTDKEQDDPDHSTFQEVPDDYEKVAYRTSATDTGTNAEGTTLTTTYQAYISKTQPAGTYTGQVKYTLIHPHDATKPIKPVTIATAEYLQEVNSCPADLPEEQVYTLKDSRDEQEYKVAKLKDGKCWMVENLNIAGGTALSGEDTDFISGYIPQNDSEIWTPTEGELIIPASISSGYCSGAHSTCVYNSGNKENCGAPGQDIPCYSYFSYSAATLGSVNTSTLDDAPYSICPKGWRLPTGWTGEGSWKNNDYYELAIAYGANLENNYFDNSAATGVNFFANAGPGTVSNFLLGSDPDWANYGVDGKYWSSTPYASMSGASYFDFNSTSVWFDASSRNAMYSVRCLLRTN